MSAFYVKNGEGFMPIGGIVNLEHEPIETTPYFDLKDMSGSVTLEIDSMPRETLEAIFPEFFIWRATKSLPPLNITKPPSKELPPEPDADRLSCEYNNWIGKCFLIGLQEGIEYGELVVKKNREYRQQVFDRFNGDPIRIRRYIKALKRSRRNQGGKR